MNSQRRHLLNQSRQRFSFNRFADFFGDRFGVGYFVSAGPLFAVALLIINDHYLKKAYPSFLTGKISDFAGLFFFPIFLCTLLNLTRNLKSIISGRGRFHWITLHQGAVAILLTDIIFVSVKLVPPVTDLYLHGLALVGFPSVVTKDPTDLIALVMNFVTYWYIALNDHCSSR